MYTVLPSAVKSYKNTNRALSFNQSKAIFHYLPSDLFGAGGGGCHQKGLNEWRPFRFRYTVSYYTHNCY